MDIMVTVNGEAFAATLADTDAARELADRLEHEPLVLHLADYSGFEKVGELGFALTATDERITTQAGDIVLYQGDQIVLFYASNTWAYTRLARVDDLDGWESALGGDVDVTLTLSD